MRKLLVSLFVVGLVVAPSFGASVDVKILVNGSANPTILVGNTATVEGWFKCESATEAVCAIGGSVTASGPGLTLNGALASSTFYTNGSWPFQGFQPLQGQPGTQILPATPADGTQGAVISIGSAQGIANQVAPAWIRTADYGANNTWVKLFSYSVNAAAAGTVTLQWAEAAAGGNGGWYTTDTAMVNGINTNTAAVVTIQVGTPPRNLVSSTVDNSVAGKKTLWRTKKSVVRLTFDTALTAAPTAGQIKIVQCLAGGVEGADLSSNFTFTLESGGTVVKCLDSSAAGVLTNRTWYAIRLGTLPNTNAFTKLIPVLVGDYDGNGVLSAAGDINPIVAKLSSPSVSPNDADRRDLDGNMVISAAADVNPAVAGLATPTLPAKPTGW